MPESPRPQRASRERQKARRHAIKGTPSAPSALAHALVASRPGGLSDLDAAVSKRLVELGVSVEDIACLLGHGDMAIRNALKRAEAAEVLYQNAQQLAQDWVRASQVAADEGRHEPAMAALQAIQAVERPEAGSGRAGAITVNVGVALPGTPGSPLLVGGGERSSS